MTKIKTHHDNLKVSRDAPQEVINAAYKALALKYHPDTNPGKSDANKVMQIINDSYAALTNHKRKSIHDAWIKKEESAQNSQSRAAESRQQPKPPAPPPRPKTEFFAHKYNKNGFFENCGWKDEYIERIERECVKN